MNKGFTLIELLVVVLIIGILAAVALPQYTKAVEKSRATEAIQLLGQLANAENIYYMAKNQFTDDLTLLDIQLPGLSATSGVAATKNFQIQVTSTNPLKVQAKRLSGYTYYVNLQMDSNGTITRWCNKDGVGTAATTLGTTDGEKICKSIANGEAKGLIK